MTAVELVGAGPRGTLAGTLHVPAASPAAVVLMVPGSGPMDRDNDGYFPAIRNALVERGIAVASFDKRGVGGSAGDWRDTGPSEQDADADAALEVLRQRRELRDARIGLFGHSQGGWVVLEVAAADAGVAFVVTSSGPGVTPAAQERFALSARRRARGEAETDVQGALRAYDTLVALVRDGADVAAIQADAARLNLQEDVFIPGDDGEFDLMRRWLDHHPRPALERIACPVLAMFGGDDRVVPVAESAGAFAVARTGRPGGLEVAILDGADHRLQVGGVLHPRYAMTVADWIHRVVA